MQMKLIVLGTKLMRGGRFKNSNPNGLGLGENQSYKQRKGQIQEQPQQLHGGRSQLVKHVLLVNRFSLTKRKVAIILHLGKFS
jgi:hypothetical protein